MKNLLRTPLIPVWFLLVLATALSWWLGADAAHTTIALVAIAFVKSFLVGMFFMELLDAPKRLRLGFTGWCGAGLVGIVGIYPFA